MSKARVAMFLLVLSGTIGAASAVVSAAAGSQLIDRNASDVSLRVNAKGEALLTYRAHGRVRHVLAWGAVNALVPTAGVGQVKLRLDYTGGYGKYFKDSPAAQKLVGEYRRIRSTPGYLTSPIVRELARSQRAADLYWRDGFHGSCGPYDGPPLAWAVVECKAPDGSYWAVQAWQRELPDYGNPPTAAQASWELRLSHWTGALPQLTVATDWSWHRWDHLYGRLRYLGAPAYGFLARSGTPLDGYGRNVYIDTLDSAYGRGWHRENSALTHVGTGVFCYSFNPHGPRPAGRGPEYRITVIGPGVSPDVTWRGPSPGRYSSSRDARANAAIAALHDRLCRPN